MIDATLPDETPPAVLGATAPDSLTDSLTDSVTDSVGGAPTDAGGDATRWLDPEEQRAWRSYLRGAALVMDALDRDLQVHGVSLSEYEILALVSESPGRRQRMSVLADAVVQSRSRLTHTAARLERRGWVQRRQSAHDRRGVELCLTAAGLDVLAALAPVHVEGVRRVLLDPLGRATFLQLGDEMATVGQAAVET